MRYVLLASLLLSQTLFASEDWLCAHEASQRRDNEVLACGIGLAPTEPEARKLAFTNAKQEFKALCAISADCLNRIAVVTPSRTECERVGSPPEGYRCTRLLIFTLGGAYGAEQQKPAEVSVTAPEVRKVVAKVATPQPSPEVLTVETEGPFKPFVVTQIAHNPKVRKGMNKAAVMKAFGAPESAEGNPEIMMMYSGAMCQYDSSCFIHFDMSGHVTSYSDFKPIYTADLE